MCCVLGIENWLRKANEIAQWLRALSILADDPGFVTSTHNETYSTMNSSSGGSGAFFWTPGATEMHVVQIYVGKILIQLNDR